MVSFAASYEHYRIPAAEVREILDDMADTIAANALTRGRLDDTEGFSPTAWRDGSASVERVDVAETLYNALGGNTVPKSVASEYAGDFASDGAEYVNNRVQSLLKQRAFKKSVAKRSREMAAYYKKQEPTIENLNMGKDLELAAEEIEEEL